MTSASGAPGVGAEASPSCGERPAPQRRPPPVRTLAILCAAGMIFSLAQTALAPSISVIQRDLHASQSGVTWTVTGYLVCAAVFTPLFGRLGDMYGKRRMLVLTMGLFALGNLVSALGTSLAVVVGGRVLQGTAGGTFPLCFSIVRDEFPVERVRTSIGTVSATAGIGAGFGLAMGGLVADHASYHAIFWINTVAAGLVALAVRALVPESPVRSAGRVDARGAALLAVGIVAVLVAISEANRWGWIAAPTLALLLVGIATLTVFVCVERRTPAPMANIATLAKRPVLLTNGATVLTGYGLFGSLVLVPQLAEAPVSTGYGFGSSATQAGLLMAPGSLLMLATGPVSGRIGARYGSRFPLVLGTACAAAGQVTLAIAHGTPFEVLCGTAIVYAGIGLAFAALPNLIVDAVPRSETGEATGFNALVRSIGASLGTQVSAALLAATVVAGGHPTESGFRAAFLVTAAVAICAAVVALTIPPARGDRPTDMLTAGEEIGAAGPLAEPAYSGKAAL